MDNRDTRKRTRTTITPAQLLELGKLPPQCCDIESVLLGGILLDQEALEEVIPLLKPESFYKDAHKHIYEAIVSLHDKMQTADILTVVKELKRNGNLELVGGAYFITTLTDRIGSGANAQHHAMLIKEAYVKRELIRMATEVLQEAYQDTTDTFELIEKFETSFSAVNEQMLVDTTQTMKQVMETSIQEIEAEIGNKGLTGVSSGFIGLDRLTHGYQKKNLVIIAARPSVGKSTFMLNSAINAYHYDRTSTLIFSLEMNATELGKKILSTETDISYLNISRSKIDPDEFNAIKEKANKVGAMPIYIEDRGSLTINQIKSISRKYVRKLGVKQIMIDYLQKVKGSGKITTREQEVSMVTTELKNMAKSLNVPVIALCMLGRSVEESKDKIPTLAALRESGQIEAEADLVILMWRPAAHKIFKDAQGNDVSALAKLIIAKHRGGSLGDVKLKFVGSKSKFITDESDDNQAELVL